MKHRHVSRDIVKRKITRSLYNRTTFFTRLPYNNAEQTNSFTSSNVAPIDLTRSASLSWMESVPYWLKQHERTSSFVNTRLYKSSFFFSFYLFSFLFKASTLDNNIVSLLDFWFFFLNTELPLTLLALFLSFARSLPFSLSLSHSHEKYLVVHDRSALSCITWFQLFFFLVQFYDFNIASVSQLVCRQHDY